MNRLSIRAKFLVLVVSISAIFIASLFVIKGTNTRIADNFDRFYQDNFSVSLQVERLKEAQVDIMVDVRGLQIAYLLNLDNQIPGYLSNMQRNYEETPSMLENLSSGFRDDPAIYDRLVHLVNEYQSRTRAFVQAMNDAPDNRAPFPIFSAFSESYSQLSDYFDLLKTSTDQAATQSQREAESAISMANRVFYLSLLIAILAALGLSFFISRDIINGIARVRELATQLAKGNLMVRADVTGTDEVAVLGRSLNDTMEHLGKIIRDIARSADIVGHNSERVLKANSAVQRMSTEITDNTHQVVTAIEEMSATSKNIAENTTETARASGEMERMVNQGMQASASTMATVQQMVESLQKTSGVVGKLQEELASIEKILDVIRGISEQTNLLALNAAIEAARAGEQGRGFAVVADEVRTLAQRSQGSVDEIESLLTHLRSIGQNAVARMSDSSDMAGTTSEQIEENNAMLAAILDAVEQVNGQAQQIATAAEEQSAVAVDISQNMHAVQALTQQSAETAIQTSEFSEEMHQVSRQVLAQLSFFKVSTRAE